MADSLDQEAQEWRSPFKDGLNSSGRRVPGAIGASPHPYRAPTRRLAAKSGVDFDRALAFATACEDAEVVRRLSPRK